MNEKVLKLNGQVKRQQGYLYFLDSEGDISRTKMARGRTKEEN